MGAVGKNLIGIIFLGLLAAPQACNPDRGDDAIPYVEFADITIEVTLPTYNDFYIKGYVVIDDSDPAVVDRAGVRGIIVYKLNEQTYLAYEQNCSYHPNDACATVSVNISNAYMEDPCCGSTFSLTDGSPTGAPAWRPLRQYHTSLDGTTLTITDDVIN